MRTGLGIAAFLLLALGGCGDDEAKPAEIPPAPSTVVSEEVTPSPVTTTMSAAATPARTTRKPSKARPSRTGSGLAGFVSVVQARLPEVAVDRRDEEIEAIAQQACASLTARKDADEVVAETRARGTDQATARELIKLAIDTVCPDRDNRADDF